MKRPQKFAHATAAAMHVLPALASAWTATPAFADEKPGAEAASLARKDDPPPIGLSLGARIGMGLPIGMIDADHGMGDSYYAQAPVGLELDYAVTPLIQVGAYGQYGLLFSRECGVSSCSGNDIRMGVHARVHPAPGRQLDPWLGVGAGYEWLSRSFFGAKENLHGMELLNFELGADYKASPSFGIGPYVGFSLDRYQHSEWIYTYGNEQQEDSRSIDDQRLHSWLVMGFRGAYSL